MNLPFVCYLALLGIVYIYNVHTTEKNLRRIEALEKVVKDTESKYMNLKQEVMYGSTQSQMQDKVASMDLKYTGQLPKKIKVDKKKKLSYQIHYSCFLTKVYCSSILTPR